jgi:hypothetical protein
MADLADRLQPPCAQFGDLEVGLSAEKELYFLLSPTPEGREGRPKKFPLEQWTALY